MTAATTTLTEFLLARIAEDEEVARAVPPGEWYLPDGDHWDSNWGVRAVGRSGDLVAITSACPEDLAHIARHDPARVLARCEADRRIVAELQRNERNCEAYLKAGKPEPEFLTWEVRALRKVAALLALPYADHPHYRDEWRAAP